MIMAKWSLGDQLPTPRGPAVIVAEGDLDPFWLTGPGSDADDHSLTRPAGTGS